MVDLQQVKRPLNLGHRGALSLAPENTLASFARARDSGADGVEFDVQLSADAQLVIIHDHTLERTTDGRGGVVSRSLAELKQLDAGRWFDPGYAGERIPTLQEVIDLLGNQMLLNIEIKSKPGENGDLEQSVIECIRRNRCEGKVLISSFNMESLRRVRQAAPELPIGVLYSHPLDEEEITDLRAEAVHPQWTLVDEDLVQRAHAAGRKVNVWTVNEEADQRRMIALGVDAIITNFPQRLASILHER
jgi:glycerophosphoryl diester phosphodiesterase